MEAAMAHPLPHWTVAARRQSNLLFQSGRVTLLLLANAAALLLGELRLQMQQVMRALGARPEPEPVMVSVLLLLVFIGIGWSLLVWNGEGPARRQYHHAMPVSRTAHDLLRVATGAAWLLVGSAFFCVLGLALSILDGTPHLLKYGPSFWMNCFTLPLLPYLGASVVTLRVNHPMLWIVYLLVAFAALISVIQLWQLDYVSALIADLFSADYGFASALVGGYRSAKFALMNQLYTSNNWHVPPVQDFLIANAIWMPAFVSLVALAARWRT